MLPVESGRGGRLLTTPDLILGFTECGLLALLLAQGSSHLSLHQGQRSRTGPLDWGPSCLAGCQCLSALAWPEGCTSLLKEFQMMGSLLSRIPQGPGSRDEGEDWHGLEWTEALPYTVQGT